MIKLRDLAKSSFYITPNFPEIATKRYKVSFFKIISYLLLYTFFVAVLLYGLVLITPYENLVFLFENKKLNEENIKIKNLEHKVLLLTKELDKIIIINKNLTFALKLAAGDTVLTELPETPSNLKTLPDSAKKNALKKTGGNLFAIFNRLFLSIPEKQLKVYSQPSFIKPVNGFIVNDFKPTKGHFGVDFAVKKGTVIIAAESGIVIFSDYTAEDGNTIIIKHKNNFKTIYKHCEVLLKKSRDKIIKGETIALSGNSGENTTGAHLHFEIWENDKPIDPKKILININK